MLSSQTTNGSSASALDPPKPVPRARSTGNLGGVPSRPTRSTDNLSSPEEKLEPSGVVPRAPPRQEGHSVAMSNQNTQNTQESPYGQLWGGDAPVVPDNMGQTVPPVPSRGDIPNATQSLMDQPLSPCHNIPEKDPFDTSNIPNHFINSQTSAHTYLSLQHNLASQSSSNNDHVLIASTTFDTPTMPPANLDPPEADSEPPMGPPPSLPDTNRSRSPMELPVCPPNEGYSAPPIEPPPSPPARGDSISSDHPAYDLIDDDSQYDYCVPSGPPPNLPPPPPPPRTDTSEPIMPPPPPRTDTSEPSMPPPSLPPVPSRPPVAASIVVPPVPGRPSPQVPIVPTRPNIPDVPPRT